MAPQSATESPVYMRLCNILFAISEFTSLIFSAIISTAVSNNSRAGIVLGLNDGEALVTLDFAMKILPEKAVEGQSDFFGKKGINLHIGHALAKIDGETVDHTFAHTLDDVKQESGLAFSIVRHILEVLSTKGIHTVYLCSDNAGSYKNSALISSLRTLVMPNMKIAGYFFSESQSGKSSCDRACAHCKRKMSEWTSSENSIMHAQNILEALTVENEIIRGLSTYYCTYTDHMDHSTRTPNPFPGISHYFSFAFEPDGVRVRCQPGIGEGRMIKNEKLTSINCTLKIEQQGGHIDDTFWNSLESCKTEQKNAGKEDPHDEENDHSDMLQCSTMGCLRAFRSSRWLDQHEMRGDHQFAVNKKTMTDKAIEKFNELIETRESARIAVTEQVEKIGEQGQKLEHEQGWALKSAHVTRHLDKQAKVLAEEYFHTQRSLIPPRKADAVFMRRKLADEMDPTDASGTQYLIEYARIPSEKQLLSLFSRLERLRLKGPSKTITKAAKVPKIMRAAQKSNVTSGRSKSSVRTSKGGSRKRTVVVESEESEEMEHEEEEDEKEEEEEEEEILRQREDDFFKQVIEEEIGEIFL